MNTAPIVYVNGQYMAAAQASISVFDRGFLFADAVYEVTSVVRGRLVDHMAHLQRLQRSLAAIDLSLPLGMAELEAIQKELVRRNALQEGIVYIQISRGAGLERHFLATADSSPTVVVFTQPAPLLQNPLAARGLKVVTVEDTRWQRCDIKTVSLLAASLAKQQALAAGADDAWFVSDGWVNEGSSNNAFIITPDGTLVTRYLDSAILPGITRAAVLRLAAEQGLQVEERAFSVQEAQTAAEAFSTGASAFVLPVVAIDGQLIGDGQPGKLSLQLRALYTELALQA